MNKIIEIKTDAKARFKTRENKYLAIVDIIEPYTEENVLVHIHDPGRLEELIYKDNIVLLKSAGNPKRKTLWDVIAAKYNNEWILINSMYHRRIAEKILGNSKINPLGSFSNIKAEVKYNKSRIDFTAKNINNEKVWVEIKGCTLSVDNIAMFPDAPTKRGKKHLEELIEIVENGERSAVYFLVLNNSNKFKPNYDTDIEFSEKFYEAIKKGVKIFPILLEYKNNIIYYKKILPIVKK